MPIPSFVAHERLYSPPEWFELEDAADALKFFPHLLSGKIHGVAGSLGVLEKAGEIPAQVTSVLEFGSGFGEGLVALEMFAMSRDRVKVVGTEIDEGELEHAREVAKLLLPFVDRVEQDGYSLLEASPGMYDIILANMFGPEQEHDYRIAKFITAARTALTDSGVLIINSDQETMSNVGRWTDANVEDGQAITIDRELFPPGLSPFPHMVIRKG